MGSTTKSMNKYAKVHEKVPDRTILKEEDNFENAINKLRS
jgi:hypothetical protein